MEASESTFLGRGPAWVGCCESDLPEPSGFGPAWTVPRDARQLEVGRRHACLLLEDGTVRCWGDGADGRLGYGSLETIGDDETPASAGDVPLFDCTD